MTSNEAMTKLPAPSAKKIELPQELLAMAYAIVGWSSELRFTREILAHVAYALSRVVASVLALIEGAAEASPRP